MNGIGSALRNRSLKRAFAALLVIVAVDAIANISFAVDQLELRAEITKLLKEHQQIPEYLPGSGIGSQITSILGGHKDYDELYYQALDQYELAIRSLHFANLFLKQNDIKHTRKYINLGRRFFCYSDQLFSDAAKVWRGYIHKADVRVRTVYNVSTFSLKGMGSAYVPPVVIDGFFLAADFILDSCIYGKELAWTRLKENALTTAATTIFTNIPIEQLGGKTLQEVINKGSGHVVGKMGKIVDEIVKNPQTKRAILEALGRIGAEVPKGISESVAQKAWVELTGPQDSVEIKSGPGPFYDTVELVKKGTRLRLLGRKGNWVKVMGTRGGVGYVYGDFTSLVSPQESKPSRGGEMESAGEELQNSNSPSATPESTPSKEAKEKKVSQMLPDLTVSFDIPGGSTYKIGQRNVEIRVTVKKTGGSWAAPDSECIEEPHHGMYVWIDPGATYACVSLYWSDDRVWDAEDQRFWNERAYFHPKCLDIYGSRTYTSTIDMPSEPGTYYIIAVVDPRNKIREANESNNTFVRRIEVKAPSRKPKVWPDLTAFLDTLGGWTYKTGQKNVVFKVTLKNSGGECDNIEHVWVGLYLSKDKVWDDSDELWWPGVLCPCWKWDSSDVNEFRERVL
ncbi:hypothetical protein J7K97_00575 [Candidatus Aerophobetes bacterium]|nr:hypothetical protein [Candidatus Aerophobetes bacterium]